MTTGSLVLGGYAVGVILGALASYLRTVLSGASSFSDGEGGDS